MKHIVEDFDFNKICKNHIEDEYDMKHGIRCGNQLSPEVVLNKLFGITNNLEKLYALPIKNILQINDLNYGNILLIGDVIDDAADMYIPVIQKSVACFEENDFQTMGYAFGKAAKGKPNPFNNSSINPYVNEVTEFLKYYYNDIDFSTCVSGNIEFYVSPDNGIIYIHHIRLIWEKPFAFISLPNIIFYTGEVLYDKDQILNEDFDFNKVKKSRIEDDYTIDFEDYDEFKSMYGKPFIADKVLTELGYDKCKHYIMIYMEYYTGMWDDWHNKKECIVNSDTYCNKEYCAVEFLFYPDDKIFNENYMVEQDIIQSGEFLKFKIFCCLFLEYASLSIVSRYYGHRDDDTNDWVNDIKPILLSIKINGKIKYTFDFKKYKYAENAVSEFIDTIGDIDSPRKNVPDISNNIIFDNDKFVLS